MRKPAFRTSENKVAKKKVLYSNFLFLASGGGGCKKNGINARLSQVFMVFVAQFSFPLPYHIYE